MANDGRDKGRVSKPKKKRHKPWAIVPAAERVIGRRRFRWFVWGLLVVTDDTDKWRLNVEGSPDPRCGPWSTPMLTVEGLKVALRKIKDLATSDGPPSVGAADDAGLYPSLWEHLSLLQYPDGEKRETSAIIIVAEAGRWKGCLSDKDNQRTMWKASDTLDGLLTALEEGVAADDPSDWRKAAGTAGKRKKA